MDDDLNTPKALAVLYDLASFGLQHTETLGDCGALLHGLAGHLGLSLGPDTNIEEIVTRRISDREQARKRGDFATADRIRLELDQQGILLEDTPQGTAWRRKR